jgi:hypothetical protein
MSLEDWEDQVLSAPGAEERVAETEAEMRRARIHEIADKIVERDQEILDRLAESEREELDAATLARLQDSKDELARGEVVELEGLHQAMLMRAMHKLATERERCPICQGVDPDTLIPGTDPDDDFFEEDEPLEDLLAEWEANKHNVHLTEAPEKRETDG